MTKTRKIVYIILIAILLPVFVWSYKNNIDVIDLTKDFFNKIKAEITGQYTFSMMEEKVRKAGYCEVSSDCVVIYGKGPYGCGTVVNKNEADRIEVIINKNSSGIACFCDTGPPSVECKDNHCR